MRPTFGPSRFTVCTSSVPPCASRGVATFAKAEGVAEGSFIVMFFGVRTPAKASSGSRARAAGGGPWGRGRGAAPSGASSSGGAPGPPTGW